MDHLSLHELNKKISDVLAKHLEPSYWVVAEIGQMQTMVVLSKIKESRVLPITYSVQK